MAIEDVIKEAESLELAGDRIGALNRWRIAAAQERRPDILARLGRVCDWEGHDEEAEAFLLEAIGKDHEYPDAYYFLGFLYYKLNRLEEARTRLEEVTCRPSSDQ